MSRTTIPAANWTTALAQAVHTAQPGDTIVVHTAAMKELAESAAERMGKTGLTFEIEAPPDPFADDTTHYVLDTLMEDTP